MNFDDLIKDALNKEAKNKSLNHFEYNRIFRNCKDKGHFKLLVDLIQVALIIIVLSIGPMLIKHYKDISKSSPSPISSSSYSKPDRFVIAAVTMYSKADENSSKIKDIPTGTFLQVEKEAFDKYNNKFIYVYNSLDSSNGNRGWILESKTFPILATAYDKGSSNIDDIIKELLKNYYFSKGVSYTVDSIDTKSFINGGESKQLIFSATINNITSAFSVFVNDKLYILYETEQIKKSSDQKLDSQKAFDEIQNILNKNGYIMLANSGGGGETTLPSNFTSYLQYCNKASNSLNYDFSSLLGKRVQIFGGHVNKGTTDEEYDFASIIYDEKIYGLWLESSPPKIKILSVDGKVKNSLDNNVEEKAMWVNLLNK